MNTNETSWLAGYLEGEACFLWQKTIKSGKEYRYPLIRVASTDLDVIQKAYEMMQSSKPLKLKRYQPGKQMWMTAIGGRRALAIMGMILPYMGNRRSARITELFRLSAARPGHPRGQKAYQAKLTVEAINEIRTSDRRFDRGFQANMARKYGVCWGTIWFARNGVTWKDQAPTDMIATLSKV